MAGRRWLTPLSASSSSQASEQRGDCRDLESGGSKIGELSQQEVANRMGVDRAYVSGLELGQRKPTVVTLWHAAQALGVEVHMLLEQNGA